MEIKYLTNGDICRTMCPIKEKSETGLWIRYVGSHGCAECEHFVSADMEKQIVVCNADKEIK